jgi:hypothetical protein
VKVVVIVSFHSSAEYTFTNTSNCFPSNAMPKLKNKPSQLSLKDSGLDNIDNIGEPPLTTTSSSYTFSDETQQEESSDKLSPLKTIDNNSTDVIDYPTSMDISGGVGTPCYVVNMDNLFAQDQILGIGPKKPSFCFKFFVCWSKAKVEKETERLKALHKEEEKMKGNVAS